jgi:hypothetical protein
MASSAPCEISRWRSESAGAFGAVHAADEAPPCITSTRGPAKPKTHRVRVERGLGGQATRTLPEAPSAMSRGREQTMRECRCLRRRAESRTSTGKFDKHVWCDETKTRETRVDVGGEQATLTAPAASCAISKRRTSTRVPAPSAPCTISHERRRARRERAESCRLRHAVHVKREEAEGEGVSAPSAPCTISYVQERAWRARMRVFKEEKGI